MASQLKPIRLWGHAGPNPPKPAIIMEELGVPYDITEISLADIKKQPFTSINPNGRLPAIEDPNTGITLWESGAIVEYLVEVYDRECRLTFPAGSPEYFQAKQWLFFQTSGQGPYYGQAAWFKKFHPEQIPGAISRYVGEVNRVAGVLDTYLADKEKEAGANSDGGTWLVGNKVSYADLSFVQWERVISMILEKAEYKHDDYPHLKAWLEKMLARPAVVKVLELMGGRVG